MLRKFLLLAAVLSTSAALADIPPPPGGQPGTGGQSSRFAAIAYSRTTGSYGYNHGATSYQQSVQGAMGACQERASDCELAIWVQDGCVALARDQKGYWGVQYAKGFGVTSQADFGAIQDCNQYSDHQTACQVVLSLCSYN